MKTRYTLQIRPWAGLLLSLACLSLPAQAADASTDIAQLRAEFEARIENLRQAYEARLQAMEARFVAAAPLATAATPPHHDHAHHDTHDTHDTHDIPDAHDAFDHPAGESSSPNPKISLVLQGAYVRQQDLAQRRIDGFMPVGGHAHGGERGFTLGHSELTLSARIDAHLQGHVNFAVADDEVAVEEAWFMSTGLGQGVSLKGGRFLSAVSHANEQHAHVRDFADASLVQQVLFGEQLRQDGVQLKWRLPVDSAWTLGLEAGRGAAFPGSELAGNRNGPGSWAAFARTGGEWTSASGARQGWRAGMGWLAARPRLRAGELMDVSGSEAQTALSGRSRTWLADFLWQWDEADEGGHWHEPRLKLQTEHFRRVERGLLECADNRVAGGLCDGVSADYRASQGGSALQAVWLPTRRMPGVRLGYRFDRLSPGQTDFGGLPLAQAAKQSLRPQRHSLMADYAPSELSRFRLQWTLDQTVAGATDHRLMLQYVHAFGAHDAHRY